MGEIRISIPSENLGFPYPVCKKLCYYCLSLIFQKERVNLPKTGAPKKFFYLAFLTQLFCKPYSCSWVYSFKVFTSL